MIRLLKKEEYKKYYPEIKSIYRLALNYNEKDAEFLETRIEYSKNNGFNTHVWIVKLDNKIIGFANGQDFMETNWWATQLKKDFTKEMKEKFYNKAFELEEFALLPDYQSKGYGSKLMQNIIDDLNERDILLGTKKENNDKAINFFEKFNFEYLLNPFYYENSYTGSFIIFCYYGNKKLKI
ncbi:GNAT family N-acetyltransferase [Gemella cuniculi]|uniref:GNAT family N-acetyltransferase n=1 Tax=Gemella cuniculi TaxID=150240 RepID=UPI0003F66661|nr:GNAT family N-acetyltransferase [Gemella cuniculi]